MVNLRHVRQNISVVLVEVLLTEGKLMKYTGLIKNFIFFWLVEVQ